MLKNNKFCLVLAFLVAVGLWIYVLGVKDPVETYTLRNVPVNYINEETLSEGNLVLLTAETQEVSVSYSGHRSVAKGLKASEFKVTADLEGLAKGEHTVRLKTTGPENVDIEGVNPQKITIKIDNYVVKSRPVSVAIVNQKSDDSEPYIVQLSDETVKVEGAESLVAQVVSLRAEVDAEKVGNSLKAINVVLVPVDKDGEEVSGVKCGQSKVSVTTVLHNKKTVNLTVPVVNEEYPDVIRNINLPKTITVKGTDEMLSQIEEIMCEPIDVSEVFSDTEIELVPLLPEGIKRATNSEVLKAQIFVEGALTREFSFDETDIVFEGVNEDLMPYADSVAVTVTVSGNTTALESLTEENFVLSANVEGLGEGEHTVSLLCQCENNQVYIEYNPIEIKIVISSSNEEGEV